MCGGTVRPDYSLHAALRPFPALSIAACTMARLLMLSEHTVCGVVPAWMQLSMSFRQPACPWGMVEFLS
jgi:hypothetical protein